MSCQGPTTPLSGTWGLACWRALLLLLALWTTGPGTGWPASPFLASLPLGSALALDDDDNDEDDEREDDDRPTRPASCRPGTGPACASAASG